MCWKFLILLQERLKIDHHGVSKISEVRVIFNFICKNVACIDYVSNVFDLNIFRLMAFSSHIFLEV